MEETEAESERSEENYKAVQIEDIVTEELKSLYYQIQNRRWSDVTRND